MHLGFLPDLPMPPSINRCYAQVGRRRVATSDLRQFKTKVMLWGINHRLALASLKQDLALRPLQPLRLTLTFKFPRSRLFGLKGKPKKLDLSNRIKALEDAVCALLGIDDCLIFALNAEKVITEIDESVDVKIDHLGG